MRMKPQTQPAFGSTEIRRGFTLIEVAVVSLLTVLLSTLLATTWSGLCRPAADIARHAFLAQEAKLAEDSLVRDLGGSLSNPEGRIGTKSQFRLVGRMQPGNSQLWLCFDGGDSPNGLADWGPPDTVIIYQVVGGQLVRWDQKANTTYVVARNVDTMEVQDQGDRVLIILTFSYRGITQSYTFCARNP